MGGYPQVRTPRVRECQPADTAPPIPPNLAHMPPVYWNSNIWQWLEGGTMDLGAGNPIELFDMKLSHVGINADSPEEAAKVVGLFQDLLGLEVRADSEQNVFAGQWVEAMKQPWYGTKGHIAFTVNDIDAAARWYDEHGFAVDWDSRMVNDEGATKAIYFKQEIGGFAIHLMRA